MRAQDVRGSATTIDEVVAALNEVIAWSLETGSAVGYFAAMYRRVTLTVQADLPSFQDPARMEALDVAFANRYLDAFAAWRAGHALSVSWETAFAAAADRRCIILQHLLLGMNAHINLDLSVAAAGVAPGAAIADLQVDFDHINDVLARLVDRDRLTVIGLSPWLAIADRFSRDEDEMICFAIDVARRQAWRAALRLAHLDGASLGPEVAELDRWVNVVAGGVRTPPWLLRSVLRNVVWLREVHDPDLVIAALS